MSYKTKMQFLTMSIGLWLFICNLIFLCIVEPTLLLFGFIYAYVLISMTFTVSILVFVVFLLKSINVTVEDIIVYKLNELTEKLKNRGKNIPF